MRLAMKRPNHIDFDQPRGGHVSHFTEGMNGPIPETTDEERVRARRVLAAHIRDEAERMGVEEMLGLIDLPKPDLCQRGHVQDDHGVTGPFGERYCLACHKSMVQR